MGANRVSAVQVGRIFETNTSGTLEVLSVQGKYATVKFIETGYTRDATKVDILHGKVKDLYHPRICGVGFIGEGPYSRKEFEVEYCRWTDMLRRCYDTTNPRFLNYEHNYVNTSWFNFQNYAEWASNQRGSKLKGWHLDKDLLSAGNLEYGPDYCCFLPHELNVGIITDRVDKNIFGTGVVFNEKLGKYIARAAQVHKKSKHIGCYNSAEEAYAAYLECKPIYIKHLANKYKNDLDQRAYLALLDWEA